MERIYIYPREGQSRIKNDPLWRVRYFVKLPDFNERNKKIFWCVALVVKVIVLLAQTVYAYENLDNPNIFILLATYPIGIIGLWKLAHLYFDRRRASRLFNVIRVEFWDFDVAGAELEADIKKKFLYTTVFVAGHVGMAFVCLTFFAYTFMNQTPEGRKPLPYLIWIPFNTDPSPLHELLFVILLWNLYLTVFANLFYDIMFVYCARHLSVQFMLLKELLRNISEGILDEKSDVERFNSDYFQKSAMDRLKICTNHHSKLLMYGKEIEAFCKSVLAPHLIMSFAVLVINGFNLTVDHKDISRTIMLFNVTGSCFLQTAVYALQATDLKEQSLSILNSLVECKWYLFKASIKRALVFMLMNANKGIVITAAGIIDIDNPLLVEIIQKVFSAITLLQAFVGEDTE